MCTCGTGPNYQTTYASIPFQSPGYLGDMTLRKQWAKAFSVKPKWIFLTGWNEHIAQVLDSELSQQLIITIVR